ncbi:unnamed protein product [Lepidochelys kempii]
MAHKAPGSGRRRPPAPVQHRCGLTSSLGTFGGASGGENYTSQQPLQRVPTEGHAGSRSWRRPVKVNRRSGGRPFPERLGVSHSRAGFGFVTSRGRGARWMKWRAAAGAGARGNFLGSEESIK